VIANLTGLDRACQIFLLIFDCILLSELIACLINTCAVEEQSACIQKKYAQYACKYVTKYSILYYYEEYIG
jgi:hypothetical protein